MEIKEGLADGETVYKVAAKTEESSGLASLFSGLFGSQRVNQPTMPSGGFSFGSGSGGGSWDSSNRPSRNTTNGTNPGSSGGSRGN